MADINNIQNVEDLKAVISEYVASPRSPALSGAELNIILSKTIKFLERPKTLIVVTGNITINWQTDLVAKDTRSFAQKHGNSIGGIEGVFIDGSIRRGYKPAYEFTVTGDLITSLSITEIFNGTITIT